jgi:hypothetical protein
MNALRSVARASWSNTRLREVELAPLDFAQPEWADGNGGTRATDPASQTAPTPPPQPTVVLRSSGRCIGLGAGRQGDVQSRRLHASALKLAGNPGQTQLVPVQLQSAFFISPQFELAAPQLVQLTAGNDAQIR